MTVVGVSPPGFEGLDPGQVVDLSIPLTMLSEVRLGPRAGGAPSVLGRRDASEFNIVARLKPGATEEIISNKLTSLMEAYHAESGVIAAREWTTPSTPRERITLRSAATGFGRTRQQFRATLWVLMAITAGVLGVACLNLANLLLARSAARRREFAIRMSLGAGPSRVVKQLFTESLLLSLLGATLGMALAYAGSPVLARFLGGSESALAEGAGPNLPVLLFHWGISVIAGLIFGSAPAWSIGGLDLVSRLKGASDGASLKMTGRKVVAGAQVAFSVVVLVASGLFLRTLHSLNSTDLGFKSERLLVAALSPKNAGRPDDEVRPFFRDVRARVQELPGVAGATYSMVRLLSGSSWNAAVTVEGSDQPLSRAARNVVGPDYFKTLEIPLLLGRDFAETDNDSAPLVAIVSESFARFYFKGRDPLGQKIGAGAPNATIVGVARDTKYAGVRGEAPRLWYVPYEQYPSAKYLDLYVRTTGDPDSMIAAVRSKIASIDRSVALFNVSSQDSQIANTLRSERALASLATLFGGLAAALAALGRYGVLSFRVVTKRKEIGIRMALGARSSTVARDIALEASPWIGGGIIFGLAIAAGLGRYVASLLHGVMPLDPVSLVGSALFMLALAVLAILSPARRAARVDPLAVIRES